MDADFTNALLGATLNVLETAAFVRAVAGKATREPRRVSRADVTASFGLAGDSTSGSVAVCFPEATAVAVVSSMRGEPVAALGDEVRDAVGEIASLLADEARRRLAERGYRFTVTVPVVVVGKDHEVAHRTTAPSIVLPFAVEGREFFVVACFGR